VVYFLKANQGYAARKIEKKKVDWPVVRIGKYRYEIHEQKSSGMVYRHILRRADDSSKGVLPCVLNRFRNLQCDAAKVLARAVEPLMMMPAYTGPFRAAILMLQIATGL
jgi:hypothetical protein